MVSEGTIKVGIVGATGYTGSELLRLLALHAKAEIAVVTSRTEMGKSVASMFPHLRSYVDLDFTDPSPQELAACDVVFFATPHGVAQKMMPELASLATKVIDLSADFRLKDAALWSRWYGQPHGCPELLPDAVYGLPEVNRALIKEAKLIACPGCYPTAIQLGFLPLLENNLVDTGRLIADAKSGVSGAGRTASISALLAEAADSFKAYGVSGHRHTPEIVQGLNALSQTQVALTFVPHLVPMIRGIEATLYADLNDASKSLTLEQVHEIFVARYADEPFVDVMPLGSLPETRSVRGSNYCRIAVHRQAGSNTIIVLSVIDNLVKGAAGQAVQNMNIMCGFDECMGLEQVPLLP